MAPRREYQQTTAPAADPSTDRIRRIVLETLRTEEDDTPCERHSARLDQMEARQMETIQKVESHQVALGDGRVCFESLRKDIATVGEKINSVFGVLKWVGGAIGLGILTTAGAALLWVIAHMGQPATAPAATSIQSAQPAPSTAAPPTTAKATP